MVHTPRPRLCCARVDVLLSKVRANERSRAPQACVHIQPQELYPRVYPGRLGEDRHLRQRIRREDVALHLLRDLGLDVADDRLLDDGGHVE